MTAVTHAAVGGTIGTLGIGGSPGSFLLGLAAHAPLDLVPHWDIRNPWIDTALTVGGLGALLFWTGPSPVFWGALGGALPDLEHLLPFRRKLLPFHGERHGRAGGRAHAAAQGLLLIACGLCIAWSIGKGRG